MKKYFLHLALFLIPFLSQQNGIAQCSPFGFDPSGHPCSKYDTHNTAQTAPSFLRIITDARSGGMGDVGIALTPDANAIVYNASKLALSNTKWGISMDYTPWQRSEFNSEMYLGQMAGYFQFGKKKKQTIGLDARFFSMGIIQWENYSDLLLRYGTPKDMALTASYSRQINDNWAIGLSAKSIHSSYMIDFAFPDSNIGRKNALKKRRVVAFDISTTYKKPIVVSGIETNICFGAVISNLGNKINYGKGQDKFLPANLGLGSSLDFNFNKKNKLLVALECKKGLVIAARPNDITDINQNQIPDWQEISGAKSIVKSFSDAPDGLKGELQEITTGIGLEYWFMEHFVFRTGYSYQNKNAGGLQFFTFGTGLRYKMVNFNISYLKLAPNTLSTIDNTWRFSLLLNGLSNKKG
jgi:Type IX secretion system protein PorV